MRVPGLRALGLFWAAVALNLAPVFTLSTGVSFFTFNSSAITSERWWIASACSGLSQA